MEHPDFTERDRRRLRELQQIANTMLEEALRDPRLKRWEQLLYTSGLLAFACIFFLPTGRGATSWISYVFFFFSCAAITLLFLLIRWKSQIQEGVEKEFFAQHGDEYKKLSSCRDAAMKGKPENWWK